MNSLEEAFDHSEQAATAVQKSASKVASLARSMAKAANTGNISAIKRCQQNMNETLAALKDEVAKASVCWPFSQEEEQQIFADEFAAHLIDYAKENSLSIYEQDGALISYPSIVRLLPSDCAVKIDRKKVSTIRLEFLVNLLIRNQTKKSNFAAARLLEAMYNVYKDIVGKTSSSADSGMSAPVVPLARIYKLLTSLPGVAREYDRSDFARDLYTLEVDGPHNTRKGAKVSFPSSTGTRRRSSDVFAFIGPDGNRVEYYGVQFTESKS